MTVCPFAAMVAKVRVRKTPMKGPSEMCVLMMESVVLIWMVEESSLNDDSKQRRRGEMVV